MKLSFFALLFISSIALGAQTNKDAVEFLNMNVPEWSCEKYGYGTDLPRLTFTLMDDESKLQLMVKLPEYSSSTGYYSVTINLSEVKRVEIVKTNTGCAFIRILTHPKGLMSISRNRNKEITNLDQNVYAYYYKYSWADENIRLRNDDSFGERAERVKKALEFLAVNNGARLETSHF
jgi:hypothetical protein